MSLFKFLNYVVLALIIAGCGTTGRKQSAKLRKLIKTGEFKQAETFVNSEKFYPEEESRLLKLVELGMIQYLNGHHYQSLQSFDAAKELSDRLFTVSVSKKLKSAVSNDNMDNYYGEKYERSMIRFYQALNHYLLYRDGEYEAHTLVKRDKNNKVVAKKEVPKKELSSKERRFHLQASKNVLLEWNSLLDNYKSTSGGEVAYKDDLLAKVFGAFIHEQMGNRTDRRVALNLYKAAKDVLFKNFNLLETYNSKSNKFRDDFKKLPKLNRKKVEADYVGQTEHARELLNFLNKRIESLQKGKINNVFVMVEKGFITPKKASKIDIPLPVAAIPRSVKKTGGFIGFAGKVLSATAGTIPKIYYEIPKIPYEPVRGDYVLVVKDVKGQVVREKEMVVVNPLANLATMVMDEEAAGRYTKIGSRVAGKHLTALLAAYAIYKQSKSKGDFIAMSLASLSYAGANKAIEASERADLRAWSLLPHHYRLTSLNLNPGSYEAYLKITEGDRKTETKLGTLEVETKRSHLLSYRTY